MTAHTARTAGAERAEGARSTRADMPTGTGRYRVVAVEPTEMAGFAEAAADSGSLPWIEDAAKVAPCDARELSRLFFDRLRVLEEGTPAHQYARNTLIEMNLSLVRFAAGRFRSRGGGDMEDIVQVGTIGLIKAIDRFDLSREVEFASFAVPYITGEIKRFFRDTSWAVHVPRRLQELRVDIARTKECLTTDLDREPTVPELAKQLGLSEERSPRASWRPTDTRRVRWTFRPIRPTRVGAIRRPAPSPTSWAVRIPPWKRWRTCMRWRRCWAVWTNVSAASSTCDSVRR